ncbi:CCDC174 family protein [Wolbachia endosymbiont (group B) of Apotomis turbidana]|uniref:CCDC174 family protein n=1 Tax=Wolbachia endosymbiont (group B) of Apotomis turbidana TaxID=2953983 RepID=UPI0022300CE1|nr:CCDC174 family protein [Wolbachia endosymbiont (group B) of Apotomis turbidana]
MLKLSEVPGSSSDGGARESCVTREPISIFSQIKKAENEERKEELNRLLEALRKKLPEGFKIGAAVGEGDCFFDSLAQGLNELKDQGLITSSKGFSVKFLRESCKQYVQQVNQSKKGSWLDNALKGEDGKLCEYISRIEFTAENIENAIWGRSEIEGKMICEKYSVKIRVIELRDEEIDGVHVTKGKVGTGNNIVYIVNYRNHSVPLLSNIKKDIKRGIKVSREEVYGSIPLQNIENSSRKQSSYSRSSSKEICEIGVSSRKRKCSVTDKDSKVIKRARININVTNNEDSEFPSDLQDESKHDELDNTCQTKKYIPHHLIGLMYQLDLSVLCSLRKSMYEHKYPSLSLAFEDSEIDKFSNIVLRYEKKSIHIQVENVDKYYMDDGINYARLFTKEKRSFSFINDYFESFVRHLISKSDSLSNDIEYLIIYTNSCLNLTEEKELKKGRFKNFYPFKFDSMDIEECDILKDFLFTNDNAQGCGFYQFSQDKITRKELLKRLECSSAVQKVIKGRKLSREEIKEKFLDKLVFAVNQPNREELNSIIKNEMEKNSEIQDNYITLQEKTLRDLTASEKHKELVPGIMYEFNLLMFFLHDMFLHKNMFSINLGGKSSDISNGITINYKDRTDYIKAHNAGSNIDYSQLFPSRKQKGKNTFSINKHFSLFVEELKNDMRYFIIYTNADLDLTGKNELKKVLSKGFYPLKFDSIDMEACDILKDFLFMNDNTQGYSFYQFSQDKITRKELLKRLECSSAIQKVIKERKFSQEEMKEAFLGKLVFAINQPSREELSSILKSEVEKNNESNKVPYNYKELHEIALRWLESHEFGPITKGIMEKLFGDIKNNRSSYQKIQKNIDEEIKFARSLVGREGTPSFYQFLNFLIKGEGRRYLEVLKRNEVSLANMSSILHGAGDEAVRAFKDLYNFWFDKEGNKMQYLKTLEKEGINLVNMSSILHGARASAAQAFKDLYDLWFDQNGKKTQYLTKLGENGVDLVRMSSILSGAGANASRAFKDLYDLWFDQNGKKTQYLTKLGENGVDLVCMSSILSGAGANASKAFKDLYNLWFDEEGNKTQCLKTLEKEGIDLANMSSVLHRAGNSAAQAFKDLYNLWFDQNGKKTQYLTKPAENGVDLVRMSSILSGAGANASRAFKDLHNLWFDQNGKKTQYLTKLGENGVDLVRMSSILSGAGANASKAFKDLYNLWFDEEGNKTQCLKTLEKEGMNLANMSSVLHGAGNSAAQAFKDLYNLWFDKRGNKTQYLKILEKERINLSTVSSILHGAGNSAAEAFKDSYDLWFDEQGNRTQYLKTLEKEGINLSNISSILGGAGTNAPKAFKDLYDLWFDEQGNEKQYLKHFIEKKDGEKTFTMYNLSSILGGAGDSAKDAFEKLHSVCFNDEGKRTELLDDFYKAGFEPSNLSCMLCKAGIHTSSILKRLHSVCFNDEGKRTKLLDDFYKAGFRPCDLCSILSGAADSLEKFHDFCFIGETKKYLNHFLNEEKGFTLSNLCNILHGVRANICSALKDFHDVCFDEVGNKTQLLADFRKVGFMPSDLSNILSMAGTNANSILRNFHKVYFNKENHLNHFLAKKELFTPKDLSKILHGVGLNICPTFEKLHDLCFDKAGNKTKYLNNLIKNNRHEMFNILYKKVRKAPSAFLDEQNISEGDKITNVGLESSSSSGRTEQGQNLGNAQQNDPKVKRKTRKGTLNRGENSQETTDGIDDNPETYLNDPTVDKQLQESCQTISF